MEKKPEQINVYLACKTFLSFKQFFIKFTPRKKDAESAFLLAASMFTSGKLQDF